MGAQPGSTPQQQQTLNNIAMISKGMAAEKQRAEKEQAIKDAVAAAAAADLAKQQQDLAKQQQAFALQQAAAKTPTYGKSVPLPLNNNCRCICDN